MKINGHSCGSIFTDKKPTLAVRWLSFQAPASLLRRNAIVFRWSPRPGAFRVIEKSFFPRKFKTKEFAIAFFRIFPSRTRTCGENVANERQQRLFRQPCFSHIALAVFSICRVRCHEKLLPSPWRVFFFRKTLRFFREASHSRPPHVLTHTTND